MQKHFSVFMKLMVTVLLFGVASFAKAATVTYSLTTKVDGRTITATANLNAGDNLNDKMPQTLWRAYTTYKYYSVLPMAERCMWTMSSILLSSSLKKGKIPFTIICVPTTIAAPTTILSSTTRQLKMSGVPTRRLS